MKGNFVKTSIASNPTPVNIIVESPTIKKVVQWLTVRHPEGAVVSYPMFRADEGLAWLEMHETLRPEDTIIAVTPCTQGFFVLKTNGKLDMGTTVEEVQLWAEVSKESPHKRPLVGTSTNVSRQSDYPRQTELSKRVCTPIRGIGYLGETYAKRSAYT
jgi:hypothetical protein